MRCPAIVSDRFTRLEGFLAEFALSRLPSVLIVRAGCRLGDDPMRVKCPVREIALNFCVAFFDLGDPEDCSPAGGLRFRLGSLFSFARHPQIDDVVQSDDPGLLLTEGVDRYDFRRVPVTGFLDDFLPRFRRVF